MTLNHHSFRFFFGLLWGAMFLCLYIALQDPAIFEKSIGRLTQNYIKQDIDGELKTVRKMAPFPKIKDQEFAKWDAGIYRCIRWHNYTQESGCFHNVRSAFFPLFPLTWKALALNNLGISIFNFCLFVLSLTLLSSLVGRGSDFDRNLTFVLCVCLPSTVIFCIPYSESVSLFCFVVMLLGWRRSMYWLYFMGALGLSMSRAAMFFAFAILSLMYLFRLIRGSNFRADLREAIRRCLPWFLGLLIVFLFQYYSSGEKFTFFEAQQFWDRRFRLPTKFVDWSQEGFGMSFFTLLVICLPITVYFLSNLRHLWAKRNFLFTWSLGYMVCMTFYCLFTTGGSLHSFYRHVLCSPFFFLFIFSVDSESAMFSISKGKAIGWLILVFCVFWLVPYGGNKFKFEFLGFYLLAAQYVWQCLKSEMTQRQKQWSLVPIVIASLFWNIWLLNMYVTGAWVFT